MRTKCILESNRGNGFAFDSVNVAALTRKTRFIYLYQNSNLGTDSSGCPCMAVSPYGVEIVGPSRVLRDGALDALGCGPRKIEVVHSLDAIRMNYCMIDRLECERRRLLFYSLLGVLVNVLSRPVMWRCVSYPYSCSFSFFLVFIIGF